MNKATNKKETKERLIGSDKLEPVTDVSNYNHTMSQIELKNAVNYNPITGIFTRLTQCKGKFEVGDICNKICNGYIVISINNKNRSAQKLAWLYMYGYYPNERVHSINGICTDNRIENLTIPKLDKEITQKILKDNFFYDESCGNFIRLKLSRSGSPEGSIAGTLNRKLGYIVFFIKGKLYYAHRLAWLYMTGEFPENQIDHIDGNRANNSWSNLRGATAQDNMKNQILKCNNKSGYKGVSYSNSKQKYVAQCRIDKKFKFLGHYDSPEDASTAYITYTKEHMGEYFKEIDYESK